MLGDWQWVEVDAAWALRCGLQIEAPAGSRVPAETRWYLRVASTYPVGEVSVWPDKDGGLTETFPHQGDNDPGPPALPYRTGWLCLKESQTAWRGREREPLDEHRRLRWYVERALAWLQAAARGTLVAPGEPTWLPLPPQDVFGQVLYSEGPEHLAGWLQRARVGVVPLRLALLHGAWLVSGHEGGGWGAVMKGFSSPAPAAFVVRLDRMPVLTPSRWPKTWKQLRQAVLEQGLNLDDLMKQLCLSSPGDHTGILLLGAPIAERVGEQPRRMHLWALDLALTPRGAQENGEAWWARQRNGSLAADAALRWGWTENWHPSLIGSRAQLPAALTLRRALLIGAGTLGAALAEMLVRGGLRRLVLMDGQPLRVSNLVRHTGTVLECGLSKAASVAVRLGLSMPHVEVTQLPCDFPTPSPAVAELIAGCDLIIDATGEDSAAARLAEHAWEGPRLFLSFSLGVRARRLFCYAAYGTEFPVADFHRQLRPYLEGEEEGGVDEMAPVGCHDRFFPARVDEVWLMAALAIPWVARWAAAPPSTPTLVVLEQPETRRAGFALP